MNHEKCRSRWQAKNHYIRWLLQTVRKNYLQNWLLIHVAYWWSPMCVAYWWSPMYVAYWWSPIFVTYWWLRARCYEVMCVLSHLTKSYVLMIILIRASYLAYCDIPAIIDITACVRTPCAHLVDYKIKTTSLLTLFAAIMFAMKNLLAHSVCWRCADVYYSSCRYLISLRTLSFMRPPATCNQYKKYIIVYHYTHLSSQCVLGRFRIPLLRLRC